MIRIGTGPAEIVAKTMESALVVSTVGVGDGEHPYETAVQHPEYNSGEWIVVDAYDSRAEAELGHKEWVRVMTAEKLPDVLYDCRNSDLSKLLPEEYLTFKRGEPPKF